MKTFMLLSAVPGSGKSTWAEEYKLTHENVHIVASDTIRREYFGAIQNFNHEDEVWNKFRSLIVELAKTNENITTIADATNITNGHRKAYAELAKDYDKKVLVIFKKDIDKALEGNKSRGNDRIVPENVVMRMKDNFEEPNEEIKRLYDEIIEVKGHFDAPHVKSDFHFK